MAQFNPFQLLAPQPAKPAPAKPAPQARQKKPVAVPGKPVPARAAAAAQKKPEVKRLEAKKPEPPKYELADYYKVWDVTAETTLGRSRDDVLKTFGPANAVLSDNYRYLAKSGPYKAQFQCYDFKRYVCKQMMVQF